MQLGTLSGAPVAAVAGLKTMEILRRQGQFDRLKENGQRLMALFFNRSTAAGHDDGIVGEPWLFHVLFMRIGEELCDVIQADRQDPASTMPAHARLFNSPGKVYPSLALTDEDFELVDDAVALAAKGL